MEDEVADGFYDVDQILMEEGLIASSIPRAETWQQRLVTPEIKDLTEAQKIRVVYQLVGLMKGGKLPRGSQAKIAWEMGVHRSTISKVFNKAEKQKARGEPVDVSNKKKGRSGRKPFYTNSEEWLQSAPLHLRGTYRAYAGALKCSPSHVFRLLKKGILRAHTSANHPYVSDKNKIDRVKWVLSHIQPPTAECKATFVDMKTTIHIDEKWFYLNPPKRRFYLLPKEINPYRTSKSKNYSIKVMFMGVTGRPIYNDDGEMLFDGKFGIFPFVTYERARKRSKNRGVGTMETKAIHNVNQQVTRDMLLNKVLPCIKEKWPDFLSKNIEIQQDNARPHIKETHPEFRAAASADGFNIHLINQPAQSPDFNVLDLSLFRALQKSLQYQNFPKNVDELMDRVNEAYDEFSPTLIKYAWISLQLVMVETLKVRGSNNYKLPHIGKKRLERLGQLPEVIDVDQEVINDVVNYLNELNASQQEGAQSVDMETNAEEFSSQFIDAYFF